MKVLIIGAGIAGTTLAIALHKAGIKAEIFEAYSQSADGVGAWLTVAVNGLRALQTIDVDVSKLGGFQTPRMMLHLASGKRLATLSMGEAGGLTTISIRRADLYASLRDEALRRGIPITYGKRLVAAGSDSRGLTTAEFSDGTRIQADLIVGADGLKSALRTIIDPAAPKARYVGLLNTGGFASGIKVPGDTGVMQMFFGNKSFFCYMPAPDGRVWWFANPALAKEADAKAPADWKQRLLELFAGEVFPAVDVIRASDTVLPPWPTYDIPHVPQWHRDNMILIGDAAHATSPSSGQGASMAFEDAVTLALCLRDAPSIEDAFTSYEAQRRERVEKTVAWGKRSGDGKTPQGFGRIIRDLALRLFLPMLERQGKSNPMAWLFDYKIEWRD